MYHAQGPHTVLRLEVGRIAKAITKPALLIPAAEPATREAVYLLGGKTER